ncbi:MAG: hypothetical protein ACE5I4_03605 [Thermoplasmata archaeon]
MYLPLGLLVALAIWAGTTLFFVPTGVFVFAVALLAVASILGAFSARGRVPYADLGALFLVAATFLSVGIFLAPVGLEELYAFVGVGILTVQVTRFRTMVRPFLRSADRADREALQALYVTFLQRLGFLIILVVLLSLVLYAAATATVFVLTSEFTVLALGLAILLALLVIVRLRA